MAKFCPNCGSSIEGAPKFCPTCGNALGQSVPASNEEMADYAKDSKVYVPDESLSDMFFRHDNRLNRKRYFLRMLALAGMVFVVAFIIGLVGIAIGEESAAALVVDLLCLVVLVPNIMLVIRRLHDLDQPTWWFVGIFIPVVNLVLGLYLLFARGTIGSNQYGPDPLEGIE